MKNGILAAVLVALTGTVSTADDLSAVKVETGKWQAAIDAASAGGGGTVTIPEGRHVTGGLFLRDNVTLKLEKGAVLEGVPDGSRYAQVDLEFVETRSPWSALIMATNAVNVAVVGEGRLFGNGGAFVMGGVLSEAFADAHPLLLRIGYLCAFLGFGVKAAIFPLHAWLPMASVAPTPVTALLHAVAVVKSGVFAIMRVTFFSFGAHLLRGTWAQHIAMLLAVITIVYGSTMAVREHHFKRRLAYSTISNLSYIVLAACLMTAQGLTAALAHMVFHALMKITLFFCAGAVLVKTHKTQIESLRGFANVMPFTCAVYTIGALALMGTPLLPGFVSKWMIGSAAVSGGYFMGYIGVAAILISAVLTAIYLMSVAFFMIFRPLEDTKGLDVERCYDPTWKMKLPLAILTAAIVLCGIFSNNIIEMLAAVSAGVI